MKKMFVRVMPPIRHRRDTPRRKYAGTKEAVKSALQGIAINLNATDMAEAALSEIEAACKKIRGRARALLTRFARSIQ